MSRSQTRFERVVDAFYTEAQRHGDDQVALQAENAVLVVNNCRPELSDRWDELCAVLGPYSKTQLRLAGIAMRRLIAETKAAYVEVSIDLDFEIAIESRGRVSLDVVA